MTQGPAAMAWGRMCDRLLGSAMIVAAIAQIAVGVVHPEEDAAGMALPIWIPIHVVLLLTVFVALLSIFRLYGLIAAGAGWLGLAAMLAFAFGAAGFVGVMLLEVGVFPVLAASPATQGLLEESGALMSGPLGIAFLCIAALFSLGAIAFGLLMLRAQGMPRWAGPLLAAAPLVAFSPPLPLLVGKLGIVVFSLGLLGLGMGLRKLPQARG